MKRIISIVTILCCVFAVSACRDESPGLEQLAYKIVLVGKGEIDLDTAMIDSLLKYNIPGVSIAVFKDYKVEWARGFGYTDKEIQTPVTERTLFQAASISKPVAAMAALKAAQDEKIDLNENINAYLRSWKLPENEFTKEQPVTLPHLLSHSGGLTVHGFRGYKESEDIPTLKQILDGEEPANSRPIRVDMKPGTKFRYSGGGYTIMQQMMIDIEEKPFPVILREKVLDPLEMNFSAYDQPLPPGVIKFAAVGYNGNGDEVKEKRHIYPEIAAAGLWTTPKDLVKFAIEVQRSIKGESNKVLNREYSLKMVTTFVDTVYSLGFSIRNGYFSHGGSNEGFKCMLIAHLEDGYGMAVMTNGDRGFRIINEIRKIVAREYNWENAEKL